MNRNERKNRELIGDTSTRAVSWTRAAGMAVDPVLFGGALLVAMTLILTVAPLSHVPAAVLLLAASVVVLCSQAARPAYWKKLRAIREDSTPRLPDPLEFRDPSVCALVQRLDRARQARQRAAEHSPYGAHHALSGSGAAVGELERRAIVVAARAELVSGFLAEAADAPACPESDAARLRSAQQAAPCAQAGTAYERAASWSIERADAIHRLEARRATLIGTLEHLAAILDAIPAKATDLELRRLEEGDQLLGVDVTQAETELSQLDEV